MESPWDLPVAYLGELGMLEQMQAVHLNCIEDTDTRFLDSNMAGAVFCPGSTRWFGRARYLPVRRLLDAGIPVGLGTDSFASNDGLNFLREIRLAGAMLPDVSRSEIFWMATAGGAISSGIDGGEVVAGGRADLIAFQLHESALRKPWWDVVWDFPGGGPDTVIVGGKLV